MQLYLSFSETIQFVKSAPGRFFVVCLLFFYISSDAQTEKFSIEVSRLTKSVIIDSVPMQFAERKLNAEKNYNSIAGSFYNYTGGSISPEKVTKKILCRFTLKNSGTDTAACYFFPGFDFKNVLLYKINSNKTITALPSLAPDHKDSISYRLITVPANDSLTLLTEIFPLKTYSNYFKPRLINSGYVTSFINQLQNSKKSEALFTYVFCGLLIMMALFSLAIFFQDRSTEFLYYAGYALFLGTMFFTKQYYQSRSNARSFFFEEYLDFILQGAGICFFMAFMIGFLDTRKKHPFLHKLYSWGIGFLVLALFLYTYLHYGTDNYYPEQLLENYIIKVVLLGMIVVFLVYAARNWQNRLFRYLFFGHLLFLIFSIASLSLVINPEILKLPGLLGNSLALYEIGLVIELIFFLAGLTYKNKITLIEKVMESERLKLENERKELEKQMAVLAAQQEERGRISADMHDELGSGMTTIRLMSEIAKEKMKADAPVEIDKISASSNDLLNKMNAIIWSMNSSNDTVDNLISYTRAYAIEYFEGTSIQCKINTPVNIPTKEISGDKRRNIFLCIKETLNNALKHSKATEMIITISVNHSLVIKITDNGIGFDAERTRQFGNGLKNISRRMKNIGGTYTITSNSGTESDFELPL